VSTRLRLTLGFAGALAVLLCAVGVFLYARFGAELDRAIERDLVARSAELRGLVIRSPMPTLRPAPVSSIDPEESVAHVIRPDGEVVAASTLPDVALLTPAQRRAAVRGPLVVDRPGDAALDEHLRVLASPVSTRGETFVVLVATSLDERAEAIQALLRTETLGLAGALVLSCAAGYAAAGAVLSPMERGRLLQDEALTRQRRFLADASHQLRTPLAVIRAEVELALGPGGGDGLPAAATREELEAALDSTAGEVERLTALTDQLLVLAAADEQRLALASRDVRLKDLLTASVDRVRARARSHRRTVSVAADESVVRADPARLGGAVDTLLDNAIRHGAGRIEVTGSHIGDVVTVRVRDHGQGFAASYLERPFERFARGRGARGGTGLGLPIVLAVVEAHGGTVRLLNDSGAVVVIELPQRLPPG
jgi:signal transduction histidine kinase